MNNTLNRFIAKRRWLKRILVNTLDDHARLDLKDNFKLYYDPKDFRGPSFHVVYSHDHGFKHYEKKEKDALTAVLPEDGVFFDVGANIGLFTFYIKQYRPNMTSQCFEPHPNMATCIRKTTTENSLKKVIVNEVGLSDKIGEFKLFLSNRNAGGHSLANTGTDKNSDDFHMVAVTTLDQYCQKNNIERIDVMKIDVEGVEEQVLNGAVETFKKLKPILMIECSNHDLVNNQGVLNFFRDNNLQVEFKAMHHDCYKSLDDISDTAKDALNNNMILNNYLFKFL